MQRRRQSLSENASPAAFAKYLTDGTAALREALLTVSSPKVAFANLAHAAGTLESCGYQTVDAALQLVAKTRATVAVGLLDQLSTQKPKLFVAAVDAFSREYRPGVKKTPSWIFFNLAQFMVETEHYRRDFIGPRIELPKGYTSSNGLFPASGAGMVDQGHERLFVRVLPQAARNANTAYLHNDLDNVSTPEGWSRHTLRELTDKKTRMWNKRYEALKAG